ncbi:MAG: hypothetical protein IKA79_06520 [Lentisphaeria bacterium]|nr:hypothetical protein [Lentisphaeria bacterium]
MDKILKQENRFWGFAYVKPKTEKKVWQNLQSKGIISYLPLVPKARLHHSTKIVTQMPLLASYVFLCLDDEERRELKRTEKEIVQIELLREERQEEEFIKELNILTKCEELAKSSPVVVNPDIVAGDDVLIISGPLKGLQTKVLHRDANTDGIVINLPLFNTHIECSLPAGELKKIT